MIVKMRETFTIKHEDNITYIEPTIIKKNMENSKENIQECVNQKLLKHKGIRISRLKNFGDLKEYWRLSGNEPIKIIWFTPTPPP